MLFTHLKLKRAIKIKMEFMYNGSLRNYIADKSFSYYDRMIALYDILMALTNCLKLDENFCHLDIKPENCLISKYGLTKLSDFGTSIINENCLKKEFSSPSNIYDANNNVNQITGTPLYMSPEQIMGNKKIGITSDIYSFGIMTIEVLNGIHPFSDIDEDDIFNTHLKGNFRKHFKLPNYVPKYLKKIIRNTLEINPDKRPNLLQIETAFFKSFDNKLKHRKGVNKRLPDTSDDALRKAKSLKALSMVDKAEKVLIDALEFNPYNPQAWFYLGSFQSERINGNFDTQNLISAFDCFTKAIILANKLNESFADDFIFVLKNLLNTNQFKNYSEEKLMTEFRNKNFSWLKEKEKKYLSHTFNKEYCLCVKCGEMKDYIFDRCSSCGYLPHTDNDIFNSHNLKVNRIKDDVSPNLYVKSIYLRNVGKCITEFVKNMEKDPNYEWVKKEFFDTKSGKMLQKMAKADMSWLKDWKDILDEKN